MILWIVSPYVVAVRIPSNTLACRTPEKLLLISGRFSRAVRAASAELLVRGMYPTFFNGSGQINAATSWTPPGSPTSSVHAEFLGDFPPPPPGNSPPSLPLDPAPSHLLQFAQKA